MTTKNSPYAINVYDLERRPGTMREERISIPVTAKLGEGLISVPEGATIDLDLRLESMHEGILATGDATTTAVGVCGRCLIDIEQPVQVDFQELFAYPSDEAFDHEVHDDHVDLEPLIRDAVVLSLPFQPVCRPDCPGLDPETGERLADVPDREPTQTIDPRWSALAGFQASDTDDRPDVSGTNTEKR
ncbi:YceD family protein [Leifsonia virtsii]|uniref:YceD family protein n=1 Tax=Leifsonia virtsii TaxID=3035915 RepID=A0ABT8IUL3_9MICO|nr:YceD family protein [Leifsonia virtsii]MDN4596494.1 YceD family protein [Leifsonia virtsii]